MSRPRLGIKGKYNLGHQGYTIGYAIAKKPMGPYLYYGNIMDSIGKDTNHASIVEYDGQWLLFYHTWELSGHTSTHRLWSTRRFN